MPVVYPIYSLGYRRPDQVAPRPRSRESEGSIRSDVTGSCASLRTMPSNPKGVPEALSFDRIISGGCCPPLTKREFLNFLKYHERAAENLQFFLWYQDYVKRFNEMPESERALAPEWTETHAEAERKDYRQQLRARGPQTVVAQDLFQGSDFEEKAHVQESIDGAGIQLPIAAGGPLSNDAKDSSDSKVEERPMSGNTAHTGMRSLDSQFSQTADSAFADNGLRRPFTVQPYRGEISRILTVYVVKDSPRELNISGRERRALLKALEYTTHPSAFREVINNVEYTLRQQAHPNFVRHAICNGNRPRVLFARGLGIFLIIAGIVTDVLITLSSVGRGWRVLPLILLVLGVSTLIAAWKGMCVVLHGLHHQHVRPYELFADDDSDMEKSSMDYNPKTSLSIDSLTSTSSNSFEDEPWIEKYQKRNLIRKIFDREVWIQEPALRQIQDTIFVQSLLGALLVSAIVIAIFVAVPAGHIL